MKNPRLTAFKIFDDMVAGEKLRVSVFAKKEPDLFIQIGKEYIDKGGDIMFNADYSVIYKVRSMADILAIADGNK